MRTAARPPVALTLGGFEGKVDGVSMRSNPAAGWGNARRQASGRRGFGLGLRGAPAMGSGSVVQTIWGKAGDA